MTRTVMIVGLIAALALTIGGPGLSITPATAEMMETHMSMMKATGVDLMALRTEITAIQAELQRLTARAGAMTKMADKAASDYCASVPDALLATGFAPGLCKKRDSNGMLSLQRAGTILRPSAQHDSTRRKSRRVCG